MAFKKLIVFSKKHIAICIVLLMYFVAIYKYQKAFTVLKATQHTHQEISVQGLEKGSSETQIRHTQGVQKTGRWWVLIFKHNS